MSKGRILQAIWLLSRNNIKQSAPAVKAGVIAFIKAATKGF